jgi:hypothetical protein
MDTTTPGGKLILHVFAAPAEFERDVIRKRTQAGLNAARARAQRWPAAQAVSERHGTGGHHAERPQHPHRRYSHDGRHFARHALPLRQGRDGKISFYWALGHGRSAGGLGLLGRLERRSTARNRCDSAGKETTHQAPAMFGHGAPRGQKACLNMG